MNKINTNQIGVPTMAQLDPTQHRIIPRRNKKTKLPKPWKHPIEPHIKHYIMNRFINAHNFFGFRLGSALAVATDSIDVDHILVTSGLDVVIERLRKALADRGLLPDTTQPIAIYLDECLCEYRRLMELHKSYYMDHQGASVADLEDAIFSFRKLGEGVNTAMVKLFPVYPPTIERPVPTVAEFFHTGTFVTRRKADIYGEGDRRYLTSLVVSYFFPGSSPSTTCTQN